MQSCSLAVVTRSMNSDVMLMLGVGLGPLMPAIEYIFMLKKPEKYYIHKHTHACKHHSHLDAGVHRQTAMLNTKQQLQLYIALDNI